jgi:pyruvate kinase
MIPFHRTKIVATLGPATESREILRQMILAGLDIARINFSHGDYEKIKQYIQDIRSINEELGCHVGFLADLPGPKLRIGTMKNNGVMLKEGEMFEFSTVEKEGDEKGAYITYKAFPLDVNKGEIVLLDDGKLVMEVVETNRKDKVVCKVVVGGILSSKKGVNLPNTKISLPCLTEKDIKDLEFALSMDLEWIALSFVRKPEDILDLKEIIKSSGKKSKVIAKIEKPEAIENIDAIIDLTDGVMVARGDLGVELEMEKVPVIQKQIVTKCIKASKPVIIATQMMESMIQNHAPTRAEVNDVANAVMDGADAVMLSAETSVGKYPVKVIETMSKIISQVENLDHIYFRENEPEKNTITYITDSICYNACILARHADVKAIISMTNSGYSAFKLSSHRPKSHIFIFTDNKTLLSTLSLIWGVRGFYYDKYESTDATIMDLKKFLLEKGYVHNDDLVINIASMPMKSRGRTNMMKLSFAGNENQ